MLLILTWCHCTPADTPTSPCVSTISSEVELDNVACACYYVCRHDGAAALLHQRCSVTVCDCQVVVVTGSMRFNVKYSELQRQDQSLLNFYRLCLP